MADKVIHPESGEPVTRRFAEDMGFLDEAEPVDSDSASRMAQDMDDFMESQPDFGEAESDPEPEGGEGIEDFGQRLEDIGEEPIREEDDFFSDGFGGQTNWTEKDVTPFYTNNTRQKESEPEEEEPEIDKRAQNREDRGQSYENTDLGGIRVRD